MVNLLIVILGVVIVFIIAILNNFNNASIGAFEVLFVDFFVTFLIAKYKPTLCKYLLIILIGVNFFLSPFLPEDLLTGFFLFAMLLLLSPIAYGIFLYNLVKLFCQKNKKCDEVDTQNSVK
ncbi:hypothetical protein [Sulfuricurvum sp.]|uniref:hypothetical protein n=1 Tax=Sulfuricurvum sp. TaxID=2025608 RepID=UPI003BAECC6B